MKKSLGLLACSMLAGMVLTGCAFVKNDYVREPAAPQEATEKINVTKVTFLGTDSYAESREENLNTKLLLLKETLKSRYPARFSDQDGSRRVELRLSVDQSDTTTGERVNLGFAICTLFIVPLVETDYSRWNIEFLENDRPVAKGVLQHNASYVVGWPPFSLFALFQRGYGINDFPEVIGSSHLNDSIYNASFKIPPKNGKL